jgi:glycosyltransferase involved in cell wall biosynthesis
MLFSIMKHIQNTEILPLKKGHSDKKVVIAQILPELSAGGVEQGTVDMAQAIMNACGQAIVISNGGKRLHELQRMGAIHVSLPVHSKNPITIFKNIKRLEKVIRDYDIDIMHARSRAPAWSVYYACKNTGTPFVTTCHAAYKMEGRAKRWYNSVMAKGDVVISISNFITGYLQDNYTLNSNKVRLIYRGIAMHKFHPNAVTPERMIKLSKQWRIPEGASVILLPARLSKIKGHIPLIDAIANLGRDDVFAVFIGSDQGRKAYRQELENHILAKGCAEKIRIVDHCDDMPAAYMLATVVVCPSSQPEGFGRVPVESQAMGRPVIATRHGGTMETILEGETGWLVEPDGVQEMTEALKEALNLTMEQRAYIATKAMAHVAQQFSLNQMCDKTLAVYREVLQ